MVERKKNLHKKPPSGDVESRLISHFAAKDAKDWYTF